MEPATLSKTRRSFRQLWSGGMRHRLGRLAGDSKPLKTSAGTWVKVGRAASDLRFGRKAEVATKAMSPFLVFGPLMVFDALLFEAALGLVRFKIGGKGCGEGDLRERAGDLLARAGLLVAFFFASAAGLFDFEGLVTGEGVSICCKRGLRLGVTGAALGLGSSTAFTPDGLGRSVAALLDGATKSTALSMTVSSNPPGAFAVDPHNWLRKNSVTLESDSVALWLSDVIFARRAEAARLRSETSEPFGAALEPEAVSGWPDIFAQHYNHLEPFSYH